MTSPRGAGCRIGCRGVEVGVRGVARGAVLRSSASSRSSTAGEFGFLTGSTTTFREIWGHWGLGWGGGAEGGGWPRSAAEEHATAHTRERDEKTRSVREASALHGRYARLSREHARVALPREALRLPVYGKILSDMSPPLHVPKKRVRRKSNSARSSQDWCAPRPNLGSRPPQLDSPPSHTRRLVPLFLRTRSHGC